MKNLAFTSLWLGVLPIMAAAQNVQDSQLQKGVSGARTVSAHVPDGGFCVVNGATVSLLFIKETREGVRRSEILASGARLCATAKQAKMASSMSLKAPPTLKDARASSP